MNGKTILLADDESHILHMACLKLRSAGFRVVTARDGREALALAQQEQPDLLITDYSMPRLSGIELCQKLRSDPSVPEIPAIMLTASGYSLKSQDIRQNGICRMLNKPFSPRHLLSIVNEVLLEQPGPEGVGGHDEKDYVASGGGIGVAL